MTKPATIQIRLGRAHADTVWTFIDQRVTPHQRELDEYAEIARREHSPHADAMAELAACLLPFGEKLRQAATRSPTNSPSVTPTFERRQVRAGFAYLTAVVWPGRNRIEIVTWFTRDQIRAAHEIWRALHGAINARSGPRRATRKEAEAFLQRHKNANSALRSEQRTQALRLRARLDTEDAAAAQLQTLRIPAMSPLLLKLLAPPPRRRSLRLQVGTHNFTI